MEIYETSSVSFYRSILLTRSFIEVYASVRRLASLPRGSLSARSYAFVAAYVRLRRDMATAREAKHINCRLTPQKQHDLIPRRICKRLAYTSKSHSKAIPATRGAKETTKSKTDGRACSKKRYPRIKENEGIRIMYKEKDILESDTKENVTQRRNKFAFDIGKGAILFAWYCGMTIQFQSQ